MTAIEEFLERLDTLDIRLSAEGGVLRCSAPEDALTPSLREEIQARKPALLAFLSAGPRATLSQERLWFLDRLEGRSSHNNQAEAFLLEGDLDQNKLRSAFSQIIERHAILRSNFEMKEGSLRIVERPAEPLDFEEMDFSAGSQTKDALLDWARALALRPFDLGRDPLVRVGLGRLGPRSHGLVVVMHHIVCDGWSTGILFGELSSLYANGSLPTLTADFATLAHRQRSQHSGAALQALSAWWCDTLAGAPAVVALETDRPPATKRSFAGDSIEFAISIEERRALEALARQEGASLYMVVLALYAMLLARHSGAEEIVIGVPIAERRDTEAESLIGHFLNTLALRIRLDGNLTFGQLVAQVRRVWLDALDHSDLPFGHLVKALNPERNLGHAPIVQAFLNFHNAPRPALSLDGLAVSVLPGLPMWCEYLTLNFFPRRSGNDAWLSAKLDFSSELFDRATAVAMAERFRVLLTSTLNAPGERIDRIAIETADDRAVVRSLHGMRQVPAPPGMTVAFREQALRSPDATAVVADGHHYTYRELDLFSDRVCRHLVASGIRRGDRVGVFMPRGIALMAGLLGILKAGGTYVPLDPGFPERRLLSMAEDASLSLLLVHPETIGLAQAFGCASVDIAAVIAAPERGERPAAAPQDTDAAYLLYTSGSTGRPKGVVIPHGALSHLLFEITALLDLGPADRLVAVTTISFDIAALELFAPLLVGACVVLADRSTAMDGRKLAALLKENDATVMQATPATWRLLLSAGWRAARGFRMLCGGEALPTDLARSLLGGGADLWNVYGPTETTIWSTAHRLTASDVESDAASVVPIGKPIGDTIVAVCDRGLRPVPVGVAGELLIGGAGVALGYHGNPLLTEERFVTVDGQRFYRTGDKARVRWDGVMLFLGRLDDQIKLNGYRIEPAEIESVLAAQPGIRQAVVVLREVRPNDARLVAYIVLEAGGKPAEDGALRGLLAEVLPSYMVPAHFVVLDELPLTHNGKINRRALPDPRQDVRPDVPELLTDTERKIAAIWEQVLGRARVGLNDNFFAVGGHSLLTVEVQRRLEGTFGRSIDVSSLFAYPTVAALAKFLAEGYGSGRISGSEARTRIDARGATQRRRRLIGERFSDG